MEAVAAAVRGFPAVMQLPQRQMGPYSENHLVLEIMRVVAEHPLTPHFQAVVVAEVEEHFAHLERMESTALEEMADQLGGLTLAASAVVVAALELTRSAMEVMVAMAAAVVAAAQAMWN